MMCRRMSGNNFESVSDLRFSSNTNINSYCNILSFMFSILHTICRATSPFLKLGQVNTEFLGCRINASHLVDRLDALGGNTESDVAFEFFREESLPLQVDLLHLLDALVRKGDHASLTVGSLSEQIAHSGSHFHRRSAISLHGCLQKNKETSQRKKGIRAKALIKTTIRSSGVAREKRKIFSKHQENTLASLTGRCVHTGVPMKAAAWAIAIKARMSDRNLFIFTIAT